MSQNTKESLTDKKWTVICFLLVKCVLEYIDILVILRFNFKYYSDLVWKQRECIFSKGMKKCFVMPRVFFLFYVMSMFVSINDYSLNRSLRNVQGAGLDPSPPCFVFCIQVLTQACEFI